MEGVEGRVGEDLILGGIEYGLVLVVGAHDVAQRRIAQRRQAQILRPLPRLAGVGNAPDLERRAIGALRIEQLALIPGGDRGQLVGGRHRPFGRDLQGVVVLAAARSVVLRDLVIAERRARDRCRPTCGSIP